MIAEAQNIKEGCLDYPLMNTLERLEYYMRGVDGVQSVISAPTIGKIVVAAGKRRQPRVGVRSVAAMKRCVRAGALTDPNTASTPKPARRFR